MRLISKAKSSPRKQEKRHYTSLKANYDLCQANARFVKEIVRFWVCIAEAQRSQVIPELLVSKHLNLEV